MPAVAHLDSAAIPPHAHQLRSSQPTRAPRPQRPPLDQVERAVTQRHRTRRYVVRPLRNEDIEAVIGIDTLVTGHEKRAYWRSVFRRYGTGLESASQFLVADHGGEVLGFVIGEVRDWEFKIFSSNLFLN